MPKFTKKHQFITVHKKIEGTEVLVNVDHITSICKNCIVMSTDFKLYTMEDADEIYELITKKRRRTPREVWEEDHPCC